MRINAHCHIFNLQSVFTGETKEVLRCRLNSILGVSAGLLDPLLGLLEQYIGNKGGLDLRSGRDVSGKELLRALDARRSLPAADTERREKALEGLLRLKTRGGSFFRELLDLRLLDAELIGLSDFLEFFEVALAASMDDITDYLFDEMAEGQGEGQVDRGELLITPLMMDVLSDEPSKKEQEVFHVQRDNTVRQCLRHPGRVLPFYAVNPRRKGYLKHFITAMEGGGFVGMKAYPSLGYKVDDIVEALDYCDKNDIPVLAHCNDGGFTPNAAAAQQAHPDRWWDVLRNNKFSKLKLCFGHFGGDHAFEPGTVDQQWHEVICRMMVDDDLRGRIFADLSYHTHGMGLFHQDEYFAWLKRLMDIRANPRHSQILFGTDFHLVLMRLSEDNYWRFFRENLDSRAFEWLARKNPLRFLGLDVDRPEQSTKNIINHIAFLKRSKEKGDALWESGGVRANWLRGLKAFQ